MFYTWSYFTSSKVRSVIKQETSDVKLKNFHVSPKPVLLGTIVFKYDHILTCLKKLRHKRTVYPQLLKKFNYKDFLLHFNHALYQLKLLSVQCRQVFILSKFLSHKQRVSQVGLLFLQVDI